MDSPIIGQEAICSRGLGRVVDYGSGPAGSKWIKVDTYINPRGSKYDAHNVILIDPLAARRHNQEEVDRAEKAGYEAALRMVSAELVARREEALVKEVQSPGQIQRTKHKGAVAALHSMNQMVEAIDIEEV